MQPLGSNILHRQHHEPRRCKIWWPQLLCPLQVTPNFTPGIHLQLGSHPETWTSVAGTRTLTTIEMLFSIMPINPIFKNEYGFSVCRWSPYNYFLWLFAQQVQEVQRVYKTLCVKMTKIQQATRPASLRSDSRLQQLKTLMRWKFPLHLLKNWLHLWPLVNSAFKRNSGKRLCFPSPTLMN